MNVAFLEGLIRVSHVLKTLWSSVKVMYLNDFWIEWTNVVWGGLPLERRICGQRCGTLLQQSSKKSHRNLEQKTTRPRNGEYGNWTSSQRNDHRAEDMCRWLAYSIHLSKNPHSDTEEKLLILRELQNSRFRLFTISSFVEPLLLQAIFLSSIPLSQLTLWFSLEQPLVLQMDYFYVSSFDMRNLKRTSI